MWFNSLRIWIVVVLGIAWLVWLFYSKIFKNEEDDIRNQVRLRKI